MGILLLLLNPLKNFNTFTLSHFNIEEKEFPLKKKSDDPH